MHVVEVRNYFQASYQNDEWEGEVDIGAIRDDSKNGIFDPKKYTTHGQYAENGVNGPAIYGAQDKAGRYMSRGGPSLQYRHADYSLVDTGKHSYHKINEDDDAEGRRRSLGPPPYQKSLLWGGRGAEHGTRFVFPNADKCK